MCEVKTTNIGIPLPPWPTLKRAGLPFERPLESLYLTFILIPFAHQPQQRRSLIVGDVI